MEIRRGVGHHAGREEATKVGVEGGFQLAYRREVSVDLVSVIDADAPLDRLEVGEDFVED